MTTRNQPTLFGYPTGLFTLFFAEMWERFSYYGMRALLVLYMIKGFLGYGDSEAYQVYGAYTALVYMTPYFGGMLADRLLGARRAVVLGGILMAAGHVMMTWESEATFFGALALLIVGNGFFKPNISTMVGGLYEDGDPRRDAGFTLFYIGINLGAAAAPLLCGVVAAQYGWHYGFGLATVGMLIGLAVFVVPTRLAQILIMAAAVATSAGMVLAPEGMLLLAVNAFVAVALLVSATAAFVALGRGGLPEESGQPKDPEALKKYGAMVYFGSILMVPIFGMLVWSVRSIKVVPSFVMEWLHDNANFATTSLAFVLKQVSSPPGLILTVVGLVATFYLLKEAFASDKIERERMFSILILMFFSMLFWAFFEQAGSSVNNFTDRNVDRVVASRVVESSQVGSTVQIALDQGQLGYQPANPEVLAAARTALSEVHAERIHGLEGETLAKKNADFAKTLAAFDAEKRLTLTGLDALKAREAATVDWQIDESNVGMTLEGSVIPASTFQSANAIFIMIFGLLFSAAWTFLGQRNMEPSSSIKFALGLAQLGLGFMALYMGTMVADPRGMTGMSWLLLAYLLHTTGELCLSPVGLSMVTRLAPKRLVSTVMGAWFLATAFSNYLAAIIAIFTGVSHGDGGNFVPVPSATLHTYGGVFLYIGIGAVLSAFVLAGLSPLLKAWMHEDTLAPPSGGGH